VRDRAALVLCAVGALARPAAAQELERLTLDQAVQRAVARNTDVLIAAAEVRRAEGLVAQARAGALPTLFPAGTYTRIDHDRKFQDFTALHASQWGATAPLAVPLIAPQPWAEWAHAIDDKRAAILNVRQVQRQVAIAVANAYLTVITQRRLVEVAKVSRDNAASHADYTRQQSAGGVVSELDAVRAQQQLHTTTAQLQVATLALNQSREALGVLVAGDRPIDAADPPQFRAPSGPGQLEARADVVWMRMRQTAAHNQLRDAYTEYLPFLTGVFQPIYTQPPTFTQPRWGWQLQLTLVIPIYDGGIRQGRRLIRSAVFDETTASLENLLRAGRSDIRLGYQSLETADTRVAEARAAATLAKRALEISTLRYRQGATTNIEVIDAEQQARQSDLSAALAEDSAQQIRLNLLAAAGEFP
jgi:multidrug efflux system outer membrane protein